MGTRQIQFPGKASSPDYLVSFCAAPDRTLDLTPVTLVFSPEGAGREGIVWVWVLPCHFFFFFFY